MSWNGFDLDSEVTSNSQTALSAVFFEMKYVFVGGGVGRAGVVEDRVVMKIEEEPLKMWKGTSGCKLTLPPEIYDDWGGLEPFGGSGRISEV